MPIAVRRVALALGVKDIVPPKPLTQSKEMNKEAFERLTSLVPVRPAGFVVQPLSPEEFMELHRGR